MKDSTRSLLVRTFSTIVMVSLAVWAFKNLTNDGLQVTWFICQLVMIYEVSLVLKQFGDKNRLLCMSILLVALFIINLELQPSTILKRLTELMYVINRKKTSISKRQIPKLRLISSLSLIQLFQMLVFRCGQSPGGIEIEGAAVSALFAAGVLICFCGSYFYLLLDISRWLVVFQIGVVALNDTGAYLGGCTLGRKIFKRGLIAVSPSKTIEGYISGMVASILGALVLGNYIQIKEKAALAFGVYVAILGPLGGFYGSLVKRAAHIKDFGWVIPGHGGLIDRFDCQLISAPVLWMIINIKW